MSEAERPPGAEEPSAMPVSKERIDALRAVLAETQTINRLETENRRLSAEVEALRKDRAIIDWLISEKMLFCWIDKDRGGNFTAIRATGQVNVRGFEGDDVRAAIDAAMKEAP